MESTEREKLYHAKNAAFSELNRAVEARVEAEITQREAVARYEKAVTAFERASELFAPYSPHTK